MKIPLYTIPNFQIEKFLRINKIHKSWESVIFSKWRYEFLENWNSLEGLVSIKLKLPTNTNSYQEFTDFTLNFFIKVSDKLKRNQKLSFKIDLNGNDNSFEDLSKRIEKSCTRIWDGTRNLPFTNMEIYKIIKDYIFFEYYEHIYEKAYSINDEELVVLELTNKFHSTTRCYATKSKLEKAFRDDIENILIEEFKENISSLILLNVNVPQIIFDFEKLLFLFKEEIIAYQVAYNSEKINPVIFYSPTELNILGYA
jgi:hypothetical protein